jgi:hypothetical protein
MLPSDLHPTRHTYTDDGFGFCSVCGFQVVFGLLHPEPPVDEEPEVDPVCRKCWHWRHRQPCSVSLSSQRSVPCGCTAVAA